MAEQVEQALKKISQKVLDTHLFNILFTVSQCWLDRHMVREPSRSYAAFHSPKQTLLELFDNNCERFIVVATIHLRLYEISRDYCYTSQASCRGQCVFSLLLRSLQTLGGRGCQRERPHHRQ